MIDLHERCESSLASVKSVIPGIVPRANFKVSVRVIGWEMLDARIAKRVPGISYE